MKGQLEQKDKKIAELNEELCAEKRCRKAAEKKSKDAREAMQYF